jgi:hypothetical protein
MDNRAMWTHESPRHASASSHDRESVHEGSENFNVTNVPIRIRMSGGVRAPMDVRMKNLVFTS